MMTALALPLATATDRIDVWSQVFESGGVVLAVLLVLIALSVACWFVIGLKAFSIGRASRESRTFVDKFREATSLGQFFEVTEVMTESPARDMFRSGYLELDLILRERKGRDGRPAGDGPAARPESFDAGFENIERTLKQSLRMARARLEHLVGFLATVGSAAPFIGLFGTVWGIMNAFHGIDPDEPILETVTPHIAEALVATAVGLLAAIPAVMAYNWLIGRLDRLEVDLEHFGTDFLNILRRHFFS